MSDSLSETTSLRFKSFDPQEIIMLVNPLVIRSIIHFLPLAKYFIFIWHVMIIIYLSSLFIGIIIYCFFFFTPTPCLKSWPEKRTAWYFLKLYLLKINIKCLHILDFEHFRNFSHIWSLKYCSVIWNKSIIFMIKSFFKFKKLTLI